METKKNEIVALLSPRALEIGASLTKQCPENDCAIYLNIYRMRIEVLEALEALEAVAGGWGREVLVMEANRLARQLEHMARTNYAVRNYAAEIRRKERRGQQPAGRRN